MSSARKWLFTAGYSVRQSSGKISLAYGKSIRDAQGQTVLEKKGTSPTPYFLRDQNWGEKVGIIHVYYFDFIVDR